jgi:hypothetical protein
MVTKYIKYSNTFLMHNRAVIIHYSSLSIYLFPLSSPTRHFLRKYFLTNYHNKMINEKSFLQKFTLLLSILPFSLSFWLKVRVIFFALF